MVESFVEHQEKMGHQADHELMKGMVQEDAFANKTN
jgi:hypothetical protein